MQERRTSQGAWEFTDTDTAGNLVTRQFMGYSKREALKLFRQELRGYSLTMKEKTQTWMDVKRDVLSAIHGMKEGTK